MLQAMFKTFILANFQHNRIVIVKTTRVQLFMVIKILCLSMLNDQITDLCISNLQI